MRTFAKLFGRSPIEPLQAHMAKVTQCVQRVGGLVDAMREQRYDDIERLAKEVSALEHEADQIKHDIQAHLRWTAIGCWRFSRFRTASPTRPRTSALC